VVCASSRPTKQGEMPSLQLACCIQPKTEPHVSRRWIRRPVIGSMAPRGLLAGMQVKVRKLPTGELTGSGDETVSKPLLNLCLLSVRKKSEAL
jgi:hypothetical protein